MSKDKTDALNNFAAAHAGKPQGAPKAEKVVEETTSRAPEQPASDEVKDEAPKHRKSAADSDHELFWAYQQGRSARQNAIAKEDAPHDPESDEYKAWLKGWKYEDNA